MPWEDHEDAGWDVYAAYLALSVKHAETLVCFIMEAKQPVYALEDEAAVRLIHSPSAACCLLLVDLHRIERDQGIRVWMHAVKSLLTRHVMSSSGMPVTGLLPANSGIGKCSIHPLRTPGAIRQDVVVCRCLF